MARRLLIPAGILVVILVAAVMYLGSNLDSIVKKAITKLGSDSRYLQLWSGAAWAVA